MLQQQTKQHRNVDNMLPKKQKQTKRLPATSQSMLIIITTTLLLATFDICAVAAVAVTTTTTTKYEHNVANTTQATPAYTTNVAVERLAIGATSLAAAAAAAEAALTAAIATANLNASHAGGGGISNSDESPLIAQSSANLLLEDMQHPGNIVNLTRHHDGDVFRTTGVTHCNADTCVGLSSGTAGIVQLGGGDKYDIYGRTTAVGSLAGGGAVGHSDGRLIAKRGKQPIAGDVGSSCDCRCLPYLSTYREDLGICVDDIRECTLSPFVSGSSSEKIPFVFLPLRGQIIYPSREISFPEIRTPVCAVTGAQYLTTNGWTDLRNPIDTDYPFRMFRDEGRTFLQWLGEPELRQKMQGRLIVVHLVCRDMMLTFNVTKELFKSKPPKNVFSPCVAFRVNGSPVKYFHNVSEVLFQAETTSTLAATSDGMSTKEYVVIGVCSLLLGLIYVSSVFLYLHMKKRKTRDPSHMRNSLDDLANEINYPKNDQVTFGAPFNRSGSIYSGTSLATTSNEPRSRASISSVHLKGEEMGIVKSNPLLQHFPQLSELHSGFASDISNSNSECEMDGNGSGPSGYNEKLKQLQTSALVHPNAATHNGGATGQNSPNGNGAEKTNDNGDSASQEQECLPQENVSIVEDMMSEEKMEQMRAMVNGTVRKKLYFNPAYFEPHLLAQPPPAAIEFLTKIREVIAIAKYKMASKRFQPSLIVIPEEGPMRSNTPSLYSSQLQLSGGTDGCRGCATNRCSGHIKNCGDKRNSIEKWLQSVPPVNDGNKTEGQSSTQQNGAGGSNEQTNTQEQTHTREKSPANQQQQQQQRRHSAPPTSSTSRRNKSSAPPRKEITPPKQRPPPPPTPTNPQTNPSQSKSTASPVPRPHVIEIRHDTPPYEPPSQRTINSMQHGNSATTITVNRSFDALSSVLSNAANIYGFAEMGSEIYNNPKFSLHDSPSESQRSHCSSHRSKSSRKRLEALDQYAAASTPTSLNSNDREHYEMLRNMKQEPDMIYDAIARDYNATLVGTGDNFQLDIPTPDYDSTLEKKIKDIYYNTALSSTPSVPTPDYSTLSKKSLRQCQPDSPIYRRKSPQYLIVDYETDSLERLAASKRKSSQSSSSPSSDVSSQLSPSLSTALPLEEELEISHTVYDKVNGFRKEGNMKKKITIKPENTVSKQKEIEARIKYDTPFHGSMTIEVEHEPPSDMELSTDSDQYEPDTLDRKPKKHSFCDVNAWSEHMQKAKKFVNEPADDDDGKSAVSYHHLENMNSLPELKRSPQCSALGPSSSFCEETSNYSKHPAVQCRQHNGAGSSASEYEQVTRRPSFESLREIYQSKLVRQHSQSSQGSHASQRSFVQQQPTDSKGGRLLTLEAKHSRRQRLMEQKLPPPEIETEVVENKTTIKIRTPTMRRPSFSSASRSVATTSPLAEVHNGGGVGGTQGSSSSTDTSSTATSTRQSGSKSTSKGFYEFTKNFSAWNGKNNDSGRSMQQQEQQQKKRPPPPSPPPAPPPTSASTTLTSQRSIRSERSERSNVSSSNYPDQRATHFYQNQTQYLNQLTIQSNGTSNATEEETASNHSESTEVTGVSDTQPNSEFDGSCNNTLNSGNLQRPQRTNEAAIAPMDNVSLKVVAEEATEYNAKSRRNSISSNHYEIPAKSFNDSPKVIKKLQEQEHAVDYRNYAPTPYNGLRNDYSLNKYMNRRKSQDHSADEEANSCNESASQLETNNNTKNFADTNDATKLFDRIDVISLSSRSNRSSSRLSDRTKEMYRNAGVPVGIAYPQRSTANNSNISGGGTSSANVTANTTTTNVQTVYRCEIEPVQLTHGMQIAMGLKDRAKKAKDLKNAWKKFVSMAAAKFSPTASPAPPFEKKTAASFLEALERDEGISSLIDDHPQVSTPKSSYSAPASQNYYEQRFGTARLQEMDSGYMSADSAEVYKRSFYDRYNFRMMSGRDRVIRVDTIEDNSDSGSTLTERQEEVGGAGRHGSLLDSNRFEDFEHMGEQPEAVDSEVEQRGDDCSDEDSDRTLTRSPGQRMNGGVQNIYSSDDERGNSGASCGSSETDGETNVEDMWESGAESIETHSVLYKNVRKK